MKILIKQAIFIPIYFFLPVLISGFLVDEYDIIKQHASEITLTEFETAKFILNTGAILTGLSCITLSLGIIINAKKHYLSSTLLVLFGISMISNGLYPMGTPMHGLYGTGLTLMILPFASCYELKNSIISKRFFTITLFTGFIIFIYFWLMLIGLNPNEYKGLTQRLAGIFIFGWIAFLAYVLNKNLVHNKLTTTGLDLLLVMFISRPLVEY